MSPDKMIKKKDDQQKPQRERRYANKKDENTLKVSNFGTASNHDALDQTLKAMGQGQVRDVSVGGRWDEEFLGGGHELQ